MAEDRGQRFASDEHRRVVGNLPIPRHLHELTRNLVADPHIGGMRGPSEDDVSEILKDLEAEGLVKQIGSADTADELLKLVSSDKDTIDLHKDQAKHLKERIEGKGVSHQVVRLRRDRHLGVGDESLWLMTKKGKDLLVAGLPEEDED